MKRYIYTALFLVFVVITQAQEKKITLGFGGGYSTAVSDMKEWSEGGHNGYANVMYNITSRISTGIEYNTSRIKAPLSSEYLEYNKFDGIIFKGVYFFSDKKVRPYAAIMAGLFINTFNFPTGYDGDTWNETIYTTDLGKGFTFGVQFSNFNVDIAYINLGTLKKTFHKWEDTEYVNEKIGFIQLRCGINLSFFSKKQ